MASEFTLGVEEEYRALLMTDVRTYILHLLALSASSPIFESEETGYASYRTILNWRLPNTGPPPRFGSGDELRAYLDLLLSSGSIDDEYTIYWSIRAHPEYPTVEFRVTDCPSWRSGSRANPSSVSASTGVPSNARRSSDRRWCRAPRMVPAGSEPLLGIQFGAIVQHPR